LAVFLIALGGAFELYDIFLSGYVVPGLAASGVFANSDRMGFFVFSGFAGMFVGCLGFGVIADRLGRRSIFISALA
jgi:putative MFS transporter